MLDSFHWPNHVFTLSGADECEDETDNCDNHATCTDTIKGFECDCKEGWIGDGVICSGITLLLLRRRDKP